MTATEVLRRLLDERGVEYEVDDAKTVRVTRWGAYGDWVSFIEYDNGDTKLCIDARRLTPEQAIEVTLGPQITGDTSDGYHTFNELYHHRAVLFSVIVRDHADLAWKSKMHHDGTMYDDMFIVGIETPQGQATYHYDIEPYWEMFDCKELERAPEWDGHTPDQAIERIATLGRGTCHDLGGTGANGEQVFNCSECGCVLSLYDRDGSNNLCTSFIFDYPRYCPECGRRVVEVDG